MELLGEYIGQDGQRQELRVRCEAPGDADPFQGLLSGVAQMRELVAELFAPLAPPEAHGAAAAADQAVDGDDEDDGEDENNIDSRTNSDGPSAKRPKPPS
ncbi:EKC/KEOPS complex subunit GON7 [Talpa occidentalis]|uniref:EKC/KEOPS complex subunit GON7 n=1 Tax=Talpa occidentalis TaxID=50954 RepID=UPI00188F8F9C|nr:EKC/KEOPS complex subunit GON7 [Talpa occidentalis]